MKYAEEANYWDTTVHPAKSLGEIQEMLDDFGAEATLVTQGKAGGKTAWLVRFQWNGRSYRFSFVPLDCRWPNKISSFGGKRRAHEEQTRYQMGRIAVWFVKAVLTAANAQPAALFGFLELPGSNTGAYPATAAELDLSGITSAIPPINLLQLNSCDDVIEGEVQE